MPKKCRTLLMISVTKLLCDDDTSPVIPAKTRIMAVTIRKRTEKTMPLVIFLLLLLLVIPKV